MKTYFSSTVDDIPPVVLCIDDISKTIPLGVGGYTMSWNEPTATDNSGQVSLSSRSHSPGSYFSTGSTQVTYIFSDAAGNTASCIFAVTVIEGKDCKGTPSKPKCYYIEYTVLIKFIS